MMLDFHTAFEGEMDSPEEPDLPPLISESQPEPSPTPRWKRYATIALAIVNWFYLLAVLAIWALIWFAGDRWWFATMFLFSPRRILFLPLIVLVPLSLIFRRRWLWGLAGVGILIAWPIMDLRITRRGLFPQDRTPSSVRVLTLNTHFGALDPLALRSLIASTNPDIIALQEWMAGNRPLVFPDSTWHIVELDAALLASRYPIESVGLPIRENNTTSGVTYRYLVQLPQGPVTFFSVHLASPHAVFRNVLSLSPRGPARLAINIRQRLLEATKLRRGSDDDTILAGDFNLPRDSTIYRRQLAGFTDAFTAAGLGWGITYYSHWTKVRIDHVLTGKNWHCDRCWVGPAVGSPHHPVIADLSR
jgi:vancomycin resistance protein VanJ